MESRETVSPNEHCVSNSQCVGPEYVKRRSDALVSQGHPEKARALLEEALTREENPMLVEELSKVQQLIASGHRRGRTQLEAESRLTQVPPRPAGSSRSSPAKQAARETEDHIVHMSVASPNLTPAASPSKRRRVDNSELISSLMDTFDCVLCSKLLFEPVTTPCGHTFCRSCISRAIDFTDRCPLCRTVLHLEDPSAVPITNVLRNAIQLCFSEEYENRRKEVEGDAPSAESAMSRLPLFPLNAVVFPKQRFPMHIFEPRYRLMLRRIMQGSRKFGLIALKRTRDGSLELRDVGCILEVTKAERFPDGRSLIETVARERFKVRARTEVDGYLVGRTDVYEDNEDTDTEEVKEVEEKVRNIVEKLMEKGSRVPTMQHALQRAGDVPTKSQGPGALGMWLAGMLVSDDNERQNMLEMRNSVKRLKEMMAILERFRDSAAATAEANGDSGRECCIQ